MQHQNAIKVLNVRDPELGQSTIQGCPTLMQMYITHIAQRDDELFHASGDFKVNKQGWGLIYLHASMGV